MQETKQFQNAALKNSLINALRTFSNIISHPYCLTLPPNFSLQLSSSTFLRYLFDLAFQFFDFCQQSNYRVLDRLLRALVGMKQVGNRLGSDARCLTQPGGLPGWWERKFLTGIDSETSDLLVDKFLTEALAQNRSCIPDKPVRADAKTYTDDSLRLSSPSSGGLFDRISSIACDTRDHHFKPKQLADEVNQETCRAGSQPTQMMPGAASFE